MSPTPVFISYARADEHYATDLMDRLSKEPDIAPWQDRIRMNAGDFEDQIRKGIDSSEYFVLVLTPAALRSSWVQREWRYARENGRCIVPIKPTFDSAAVDAELDSLRRTLPVWMQNTQTYDFDKYWKRFVGVLQSPCQATRAPFLAGDLPRNFVQRPGDFRRIVDAVLDVDHKNPSGNTVVVHGPGGFGKTTLALSVCHDPDVFMACDGGVLWVTLGEQPSIASELERMYAALTGERPGFKDQEDAMFEVAKRLEGKRCLVVIDDVWSGSDLKPFLHGAASCSRLITTRVFNVALATDARRINIGAPEPEEAERILTAGIAVPNDRGSRVHLLAERLKRVPLLLQLANRTLREQLALGQSFDAAFDWALRQYTELGVVAFDDRNAVARSDAIRNTVEVSLGFLKDERQRCLELGVLHEDTDIPFSVVGTLWNVNDMQVQQLAQRLHDFGLVELNLPRRSIRLHDYIRGYFESVLPGRASVHSRLVEAWKDPQRLRDGYPVQQIVFHLTESLADPQLVVARAGQLVALLSDERYGRRQRQHGDPTALNRKLTLAIARAAGSDAPEVPGLIAALAVLQKSYAAASRDPVRIFGAAVAGRLTEAVERLALLEADRHWDTLARLLIAWLAPADNTAEARVLADEAEKLCDAPQLRRLLAWVRRAPDGTPDDLRPSSGGPGLDYISAILQRAGGAEMVEGLEPLDLGQLASGNDAAGYIAERDGPDLVAFARLDPAENTQYLERYIEIHAANGYTYYRNRSLWALLQPILEFPDGSWVRAMVQRIATAALRSASVGVDFEQFLPLTIPALIAHRGDGHARTQVERARQQLMDETTALRPREGRTDSWSHYQRRAGALAEVFAFALGAEKEAAALLDLARELPKGFAAFRALSALTLAESRLVAGRARRRQLDETALTSATAASHRIQDPKFCLQTTAMVNAMRSRWSDMSGMNLAEIVDRFLANPLSEEFCSAHRVLEEFEHRPHEYQTLPIPESFQSARTLRQISAAFNYGPEQLVEVNQWLWPGPNGPSDEILEKGTEVNIPDRDFVPVLAARFAAEALAADELSPERRSWLIQRFVSLSLSNPTALDTVLGRLMLSTVDRPADLPAILTNLRLPDHSQMVPTPEHEAGVDGR